MAAEHLLDVCSASDNVTFVRPFSDLFMPFHAGASNGAALHEDIRMIRRILLTTLAAAMLAACSQNTPDNFLAVRGLSVAGGWDASEASAPSQEFRLAQLSNAPAQPQAGPTRHIAVTRSFTLRLPGSEVAAVQERNLAECAKLECTVLETRLEQLVDGRVSARTSVRVAPERYPALAAAITARPAQVITQSERADDRTIAVLDVDKRLAVKTALRDRLTAMLNDPATKSVADLIAIEKELVQAQGDIEAATTLRNYLGTITDTVQVDVTYDGQQVVVAGYDFSPIKRAIDSIGGTFATSVASLITFVTTVVPWLPVIALLVWGARRGLRRWRTRGT
jgi:hypothetical protein